MKLINKTPHDIVVKVSSESTRMVRIPPEDPPNRLAEARQHAFYVGNIPVRKIAYSAANHLPHQQPGVFYIVSLIVAQTYKDRGDFLVPGPAIRDRDGNIIACEGFSTVAFDTRQRGA